MIDPLRRARLLLLACCVGVGPAVAAVGSADAVPAPRTSVTASSHPSPRAHRVHPGPARSVSRPTKHCVTYRPRAVRTGIANPTSVAVDPRNGSYYVSGSNQVRKFSAKGRLLYKIGGRRAGTGNHSFDFPADVEVDRHGNLYVTDTSNYRVQKYTSGGRYLMSFGTPGVQFEGGYDASNPPSTPGWTTQFFTPVDTEVRRDGRVYVLDNYHVKIYRPDGRYAAYLDLHRSSRPDQDDTVAQLTIDRDGNLYAAYQSNRVVLKFSRTLKRSVHHLKRGGSGNGSWGIALTGRDSYLVLRHLGAAPTFVAQEYSLRGRLLRTTSTRASSNAELAAGRDGDFYTVSFSYGGVVRYRARTRAC